MKKATKRLALKRETVRVLEAMQLGNIHGGLTFAVCIGGGTSVISCPINSSCQPQ